MTLNCFKCNQEVVFDAEYIGRNGKKIPLDPSTHTPHKCPVDQQEKNDHGNEDRWGTSQKIESPIQAEYVDHTEKGQSKVKIFADEDRQVVEQDYNQFLKENNGKIRTQGAQFQLETEYAIALYYEEMK